MVESAKNERQIERGFVLVIECIYFPLLCICVKLGFAVSGFVVRFSTIFTVIRTMGRSVFKVFHISWVKNVQLVIIDCPKNSCLITYYFDIY